MATPSNPEIVTEGRSMAVVVDVVTDVVDVVDVDVVLAVVVELGSNWGRIGNGYDGRVFLRRNNKK